MQQAAAATPPQSIVKFRLQRSERKKLKALQDEYQLVLNEFYLLQADLKTTLNNYDYINTFSSVDACIYKIKCLHSQCDNLIKQLKAIHVQISAIVPNKFTIEKKVKT